MILTPNMSQLAKKRADRILLAIEDPRMNQDAGILAAGGWAEVRDEG